MAMVIAGGIYLAAYLPKQAPLPLPIALVTVGVVLFAVAALMLTRLGEFAWDRFFRSAVGRCWRTWSSSGCWSWSW